MLTLRRCIHLICLAGVLSVPLLFGCSDHEYRVYDPGYRDYHTWNHDEDVYYGRWEHDTHRDHVDFRKRSDADKNEYWKWRHDQDHH
jgi:hypothetical protein